MPLPALVPVTINGKKYQVPPGPLSFQELSQIVGGKVTKFTVNTSAPAQASTINGNDSFFIQGGEVLTTS